jgi:protein-export membrane protein SecD
MANAQEANLLEIVLKAGALKAPVKIIEERVVGASLGEDSISKGVSSSIIAFALIILFMIFYYARGGMVADLALFINIALIFTVLASLGGTLTLPGIAGIILTMGMAVDANILIFERIREELAKGRSLKSAIDEGFKKAMSAIIDSNITSFITGLILFYFGTGMIQGFALTLMVGIISTLFTAIMVSRALIEIQLSSSSSEFSFGQPKES